MIRNLDRMAGETFDLAIVGGGIYGASLAWEAVSRGLTVALLEQDDFAAATSANSLKIIHGGFRYLQSLNVGRMRASMLERRTLMDIAPHLVHPLPVLIPAYGHGMRGREAFAIASWMNDLISFDRNQLDDPQKHIPAGQILSRKEVQEHLPGTAPGSLTGGVIFYDAQVYNSERLVLAYLKAADSAGASLANYARVEGLIQTPADNHRMRIGGVRVFDRLAGERFPVYARLVINTGGPWWGEVLGLLNGRTPPVEANLAKAINVVTRPLGLTFALGVRGQNGYGDSRSYLFIAPWRNTSLVGTFYTSYAEQPARPRATEAEVSALLGAINDAYPPARLSFEDVRFVHCGLLPAKHSASPGEPVRLVSHPQIIDHRQAGIEGMLSVSGVKYTTARHVAQQVIEPLFERLGRPYAPSISKNFPLPGGRIDRFQEYLQEQMRLRPCGLDADLVRGLVLNYGDEIARVLKYYPTEGERSADPENDLIVAQARFAVQEEMARRLSDVVFRRSDLGSAGHPGQDRLKVCAQAMASELGWPDRKVRDQIVSVGMEFPGDHHRVVSQSV